jgi:hypothetical protein
MARGTESRQSYKIRRKETARRMGGFFQDFQKNVPMFLTCNQDFITGRAPKRLEKTRGFFISKRPSEHFGVGCYPKELITNPFR